MTSKTKSIARSLQRAITSLIIGLSFAAICAAMLMTVGDILIRLLASIVGAIQGVRPSWGLFGLVDLTQLSVMIAGPLAIASAFFIDSHIRVDLFQSIMPARLWRAAHVMAALIGAALMGVCLWTAWDAMIGQLKFTTTSATLGLAYTWYWLPLIIGLALSIVGCLSAVAGKSESDGSDSSV